MAMGKDKKACCQRCGEKESDFEAMYIFDQKRKELTVCASCYRKLEKDQRKQDGIEED